MYRRLSNMKIFLIALLTSAAVTGTGLYLYQSSSLTPRQSPQGMPQVQTKQEAQRLNTGTSQTVASDVARKSIPGVVGITSYSSAAGKGSQAVSVGAGVIATPDGFIITNQHVTGGSNQKLVISLSDGRNTAGKTLWSDSVLDLAIVKVNLTGLTSLPLGDASGVITGETAIAIGNPLGMQFDRTVTQGIISAMNRTIKVDTDAGPNFMEDLLQTDASINPGNSGGPLLNARGEVIGINTIKVASAEGMGFAIPINFVKPILEKYIRTGSFVEPYLGIFALDKSILSFFEQGIDVGNGLYTSNVDSNGPAGKAGLRKGDIILDIDGTRVTTMMQLRTVLYSRDPGQTVTLRVLRGTNEITVQPVLTVRKTTQLTR